MRTEYTHEDGEEILKRAIAIEAHESNAREMVRRTAAEMGVSEAALARAEQDYFAEKKDREALREFVSRQRRSFVSNLATYVVVNAVLLLMDWVGDLSLGWSLYPLIAWGIWMLFHAVETLFTRSDEFQRRFKRWRDRNADEDDEDED